MKKYRLKDHDLQARIEALFPDFGGILNDNCKRELEDEQDEDDDEKQDQIQVYCSLHMKVGIVGTVIPVAFFIWTSDIEQYDAFNPNGWNRYPEVTPPEKALMRLEFLRTSCTEDMTHYVGAIFSRGAWRYMNGEKIELEQASEIRFRPWDDTEGDWEDDE